MKIKHDGQVKILTESEAKDLELAKKIKPKIRRYVIDQQRKRAAIVAKENKEKEEELLSNSELINRSVQVAVKAFMDVKIWQKFPPVLETKWIKTGVLSTDSVEELNIDVSAFAAHLLREYYGNFRKLHLSTGYPNPMDDKNIEFFWKKFNFDIGLLIKADESRIGKGNMPVVIKKEE